MGDRATAVNFYNAAVKAHNDTSNSQHLMTAYQLFSSACHADPTWHEAWYQAGNNNSNLGKYEAAIANWRVALECECTDEERAKTLVNIGMRLNSLGRDFEAGNATTAALELLPSSAPGWLNLSLIEGRFGNSGGSLKAARKAYELAPDPQSEMCLAFALLFNGDYQEGLKHNEARFEWKLHNFLQYPYPRWTGEPDKTVFVVADQGLGDTLSFSRFVERASKRAKFLHLYIQPQLYRLFTHAFSHLRNVNFIPAPAPFPAADYWTTFISLPFALGLTTEEIKTAPNFVPPRIQLPGQWKVPDKKLHVGIAWAGSPLNEIDKHRNIPVEQFLSLYKVPSLQLYSLQVGDRSKEAAEIGASSLILDLSRYISDVTDTLGILKDLDLVICCESALGHIAALAGTPCWHPYSWCGRDWRIGLKGEKMLWRPQSHRTFNQVSNRSWEGVFNEIIEELAEFKK